MTINIQSIKGLLYAHDAPQAIETAKEVYLVDSPESVGAMWNMGYKHTVCVSEWTPEAVQEVQAFQVERMVLVRTDLKPMPFLIHLVAHAEVLVVVPETPLSGTTKTDFEALARVDAIGFHISRRFGEVKCNPTPYQLSRIQEEAIQLIASVPVEAVRNNYISDIHKQLKMPIREARMAVQQLVDIASLKKRLLMLETGELKPDDGNNEFVKVGDDYFQRVIARDDYTGTYSTDYKRRKKDEIKTEKGKDFMGSIERYDQWTIRPTHQNFQRIYEYEYDGLRNRLLNDYHKLSYEAVAFDLPTDWITMDYEQIPQITNVAKFFKHIANYDKYGNQFVTLLWDYVSIMYLFPERKLQLLALVSTEEGTGKSTFIEFLLEIFGNNAVVAKTDSMTAKFNGLLAGKLVVGIEETKDNRDDLENTLKDLITGKKMLVERKTVDAVSVTNFIKLVVASNHPEQFLKVGVNTTRHAVLHVPKLKFSDSNFFKKIVAEIPHFLYFIETRGIFTPDTDRLWFAPELWENEALLKLRAASKDVVVTAMEGLIEDLFLKCAICEPCIRLSSGYLKSLMVKVSDKYKSHTPNYFSDTARNKLNCPQKENPTRFSFPQLPEKGELSHKDSWDFTWEQGNSRYIEFPIYRFLKPETVKENFTHEKIETLLNKLASVPDASEWVAALGRGTSCEGEGEGEPLPF